MKQFIQWSKAQGSKQKELLAQIDAGLLTAEEAAMSAAGWELKNPNPSSHKQKPAEKIKEHYEFVFNAHLGQIS
jgi:hypothetical protein